MVCTKIILAGVIAFSLCHADISGVVTNTDKEPISGVIVRLEKAGIATTTGPDGRFTLNTAVPTYSNGPHQLEIAPYLIISGNLVNLFLAERSLVAISSFNFSGKQLSTSKKYYNAGIASLSFQINTGGISFYKIQFHNREFVLKGLPMGTLSLHSAVSNGSAEFKTSKNVALKRGSLNAAIDDIIVATKTGYLNYQCVQLTSDTVDMRIEMRVNAGDITDIDGNVYQTVKIGDQTWMTENLRVTRYTDGSRIPLDLSPISQQFGTNPKFWYPDNVINLDTIKKRGALYNWYVINPANPKKIALKGWHVPTFAEFLTLFGNDNKNSAAEDLEIINSRGFFALPYSIWWCTSISGMTYGSETFSLSDQEKKHYDASEQSGFSLRLIKDPEIIDRKYFMMGNRPYNAGWETANGKSVIVSVQFNDTSVGIITRYPSTDIGEFNKGIHYDSWEIMADTITLFEKGSATCIIHFKIIDFHSLRFEIKGENFSMDDIFYR